MMKYEPRMVLERYPNNTVTLVDIYTGRMDPLPVHLTHLKYNKYCLPELYMAQGDWLENTKLPTIPEQGDLLDEASKEEDEETADRRVIIWTGYN